MTYAHFFVEKQVVLSVKSIVLYCKFGISIMNTEQLNKLANKIMITKFKLSLILFLFNFICYSQLLKDTDVIFRNFQAFSVVENNLAGKLIKSGETNTKISVSTIDINTFIALESTLIGGGEQVYIVSNVFKNNKKEKLICEIECWNGQDREKKKVKFIFEYINDKLTKIRFVLPKGIVEFY